MSRSRDQQLLRRANVPTPNAVVTADHQESLHMTTEQTQPSTRAVAGTAIAPYLMMAQRQFLANLAMASTWAAAMSAVSGSILSHSRSPIASRPQEPGGPVAPANGPDRTFRLISGTVGPGQEHSQSYWTASGSPTPSWPRWINESPTVQPDLFDEAIELLVDDDIKTAS